MEIDAAAAVDAVQVDDVPGVPQVRNVLVYFCCIEIIFFLEIVFVCFVYIIYC
jgi:hypothetical protein